ncbi:MAG: mechanosensitive ion channel [candidate division Zixibacteria bacterium]|nr:mechanosensitive ion channel [candidate division Zixibacteria bacterium]
MEKAIEQLTIFATGYGLKIISAVLILIIGRVIAGVARKFVIKLSTKAKIDPTVISFVGSVSYVLILVFTILAVLAKFGIETASMIAVLGSVGFAIGFALQGSLSNFAAGLLILVFRYYKVGDYIEAAGVSGTVKEILLFNTVLASPDNVKIMVPSSKIFGDTIKNYSANDIRRIDLIVGVGYTSSIQKSMEIVSKLLNEDKRILTNPKPQIDVSELADSSVNLFIRPWVKRDDYWAVKCDITYKIKEAFDRNNIEIPFPQQVVHMVSAV